MWVNRYLKQCNDKEKISFDTASDTMGKFVKDVRKRHIAYTIEKYKCTSYARFVPFDQFFESYEGLLYLLKIYFEDVDIICEIDFKFTFETFPPHNQHYFKTKIYKTIKDACVWPLF